MCAGGLALPMHCLQRVQTSLGIQPLTERPRNGFPHALQALRDLQVLPAALRRPPVDGARQAAVHDLRGTVHPQGVPRLPERTREEALSSVTMEVGIHLEV